jgi:hypothetical protein
MADTDVPTDPAEPTEPTEPTSDEKTPTRTRKALRERSPLVVIGGLVIALVVGLLGGAAFGIKFEQGRAKDDIKGIRNHAKEAISAANGQSTGGKAVRVIGKVDQLKLTSLTVVVNGASRNLRTDKATVVQKAGPGTASDIATGKHVVWKNVAGSTTKAAEVIVLPTWATLGVVITDATPTSMTYGTGSRKQEVSISDADVQQVTASRLSELKRGTPVVLQVRQAKGKAGYVSEVIILEPTSKFF